MLDDAYALGLVNYVVPCGQISQQCWQCLINCDLSADAHSRVDACLQPFATAVTNAPIEHEKEGINSCFAEPSMEKIVTALKTRGDEWASSVLRNLAQKAPLSLKVTLAQIHKAKSLSMADCMKMDYCLANQFMRDSDFYEGIRALLIDKDKNPHWQPESLAAVTSAKVADYFECSQAELSLIDEGL